MIKMSKFGKENPYLWLVHRIYDINLDRFDLEVWNNRRYSSERRFIENLIDEWIDCLDYRPSNILRLRMIGKSLHEIGMEFGGVTCERIRQIKEKSIGRLRHSYHLGIYAGQLKNEIYQYLSDDGVITENQPETPEEYFGVNNSHTSLLVDFMLQK